MMILNVTKDAVLNLTGLEIFFIVTTLISLFFNLYQLMIAKKKEKALMEPLSNTLISLFNDIKSKHTSVQTNYNILFNPNSPHKDISTLRWEYGLFNQNVISYLLGFQEILVGALVTLNPDDKEGKKSFKASNYGLTKEEKEMRDEFIKNWHEKQMSIPDSD